MGNDARSISQSMGEKTAKAVENQHFDKKALGIARSLYQMSINRPQAFATTLPHLLAYIDDLGLAAVAAENQGMDLDGDDEEEDGEEETGTDEVPAEQPASGKSPSLKVVPGANAPGSDVPPAPGEDKAA
jgi:hypothetical protein